MLKENYHLPIDAVNGEGQTSLHISVAKGHFSLSYIIIALGCDLDIQDANGKTGLHFAASQEKRKVVKYLMLNGANKDLPDQDGYLPKDLTCNNPDIIKLLVKAT